MNLSLRSLNKERIVKRLGEKVMIINVARIETVLMNKAIPSYYLESETGISRSAITRVRNGERKIENLNTWNDYQSPELDKFGQIYLLLWLFQLDRRVGRRYYRRPNGWVYLRCQKNIQREFREMPHHWLLLHFRRDWRRISRREDPDSFCLGWMKSDNEIFKPFKWAVFCTSS